LLRKVNSFSFPLSFHEISFTTRVFLLTFLLDKILLRGVKIKINYGAYFLQIKKTRSPLRRRVPDTKYHATQLYYGLQVLAIRNALISANAHTEVASTGVTEA